MDARKFITNGQGLPKWTNPISHAVVVGNLCFVSGQLSVAENGDFISGDIEEEAQRAFGNFFAALTAGGFSKSDVVFVDIAFDDLRHVDAVNKIFAGLFPQGKRPARTIYQVAALPFGGKIKIMGTAVRA